MITLQSILEMFANTKKTLGCYRISADAVQIAALTGQDWVRIDTTSVIEYRHMANTNSYLIFIDNGMNIEVHEHLIFFGDDWKPIKSNPVHYRTINGEVSEV